MIRKPAVELEGVELVRRKVRDAVVLGPARLVSCAFSGCRITCTDFDRRARVQRVQVRRCTATSSGMRGAICTECVFHDLRTSGGLFQAWSCLYDRVTLTGRFDRLMLAPLRFPESREFDARPNFPKVMAERERLRAAGIAE